MKKILIIAIIISFTTSVFSQDDDDLKQPKVTHSVTFGLDVANTLWGGTVNSRAMDFQIGYLIKDNYTNIEVGVMYERFPKLNFEMSTMVIQKVLEPLKNTELIVGGEHGVIHRWDGYLNKVSDTDEYHYTYGANAEVRYKLTRTVWIGIQFNFINRTDIKKWLGNNTLNLKINL